MNADSVTAITDTSVKVGESSANSHSNVSVSIMASSGGSGDDVLNGEEGKKKGSVDIEVLSAQASDMTNSLSIQTTVTHTIPVPLQPPQEPSPPPPL